MTDSDLESIKGELAAWKKQGGDYPNWTRSTVERLVAEVDRLRREVQMLTNVLEDFQEDVTRATGLQCKSVTVALKAARDQSALEIINLLDRFGYDDVLSMLAAHGLIVREVVDENIS